MAVPMRTLIYVHGHPRLQAGGSEVAAYALFSDLKARGQEPVFLGVAESAFVGGRPALAPFSDDGSEYIMPSLVSDHFLFLGGHRAHVLDQIVDLVNSRAIEVVHFHHFIGIGTDGLIYLRHRLPHVGFVFTAHEYLSLCARDGQMLMSDLAGRCTRPQFDKCAACVKSAPPAYFALREALFRQVFSGFDAVISPSRFLAGRLTDSGLCSCPVQVIENKNAHAPRFEAAVGEPSDKVNRFAFFGQINPFKGADLLLEAAALYHGQADASPAEFHLFGSLAGDTMAYPYFISHQLARAENLTFHGRYDGRKVIELMRDMDWIVVPSIWWENSPVVIEEALIAGRPIICSNIGGMAEKVEDGVFGVHFEVGNAADLAATFRRCCGNAELWRQLVGGRRRPAGPDEVAARHGEVYETAFAAARRRAGALPEPRPAIAKG
jgi:glycosyltransferase involved in cell wall biosynthesis